MFKFMFTQEVALAFLAWFVSGVVLSMVIGSVITAFIGGFVMFRLINLAFACYIEPTETTE
jgi:hypothetical protein